MKYYIKLFIQRLIGLCMIPFHLLPIRQNRVLFFSLEGGSHFEYSCNPADLCDYILANHPGEIEAVWLFRTPENYKELKSRGIRIAKHFTLKGFYYCMTSRVIVTNGGYLTWFPFREGQIRINTWHGGGAYKRLENDSAGANAATRKRMEFCSRNTDAFVSSSRMFSEHAIQGAFLFDKEILPIGMPRNDLFFSESEKAARAFKIRDFYADRIPVNAKLALYAPTFRPGMKESCKLPVAELIETLNRATGDDWYLLTRFHIKSAGDTAELEAHDHCIDVTKYPHTQHLLCAVDLLITDYSSIVWDYCLTGNPLFLYTPDLKRYEKHQGFYLDIRKWGFPLCCSGKELLKAAENISFDSRVNGCSYHQDLLGSYETGNACEELWKYIRSKIKN